MILLTLVKKTMTTFSFTIEDSEVSKLKAVLKAFGAKNLKIEDDDTTYLSSTEANKKALDKSIKQAENGKTVKIALAELWK